MPPIRSTATRRSTSVQPTMQAPASRIENVRVGIHQLFSGRSSVGARRSSLQSPKAPRLALGLDNSSSTRLVLPDLTQTMTTTSAHSRISSLPGSSQSAPVPTSFRPITPNSLRQLEQPYVSTPPPPAYQNPPRTAGVDPAEQHLAELVHIGRRPRKNKTRLAERRCAPKIKNRRIRAKILSCFISGLLLALFVTIYLALSLSKRDNNQEFHVLLILIMLLIAIFFCHSMIRLCMMLVHPPEDTPPEQRILSMVGPGGYANPAVPIRVALARDEEAAGIESQATKLPPPAYGLWRESVRVDPNRLFWQRNEAAAPEPPIPRADDGPQTANRPPSYISEDGVGYVIQAQPRSIAPSTDVPLPPHPSERGRGWHAT